MHHIQGKKSQCQNRLHPPRPHILRLHPIHLVMPRHRLRVQSRLHKVTKAEKDLSKLLANMEVNQRRWPCKYLINVPCIVYPIVHHNHCLGLNHTTKTNHFLLKCKGIPMQHLGLDDWGFLPQRQPRFALLRPIFAIPKIPLLHLPMLKVYHQSKNQYQRFLFLVMSNSSVKILQESLLKSMDALLSDRTIHA